jgi:hypothetical protein
MYINVCTMFRHVCTVLPNPVQVVRIPDVPVQHGVSQYENSVRTCMYRYILVTVIIWILANCDITGFPDITAPEIGVSRISQSQDSDIRV